MFFWWSIIDQVVFPRGELRLVPVFPIDFVGEYSIQLTDEVFGEYPALRSMIWGIHPLLKSGVEGVVD